MKKLELKSSVREMLSKSQMKRITGGSTCSAKCVSGKYVTCSGSNCSATDYNAWTNGYCIGETGQNSEYIECGGSDEHDL